MKSVFRRSFLLLSLTLPAICAVPMLAGAQELSSVKGGLSGVVTDTSGAAVPGATLTVAGPADTRTVTSDDGGRFSVGNLTPGMYRIKVQKDGFKVVEAKNIEVVINRSSNVNLTLQPGTVAETVEVSATSVEVDTNSTAIGDNLTTTFYSQVPVARNVGSLFYVAPGAVNGGGTGNSNPSISGATGLENEYVADGVSINDSGYGGLGVYSPIYGSLGTGINLSFIQEVQVKTGAFEPKYGKANGGVVQIVTKSGGSAYHGAVAAYFSPEGMSSEYRVADNFRLGVPNANSFLYGHNYSQPAFDASLELGGYIPVKGMKDKLFFFGAFNPSLNQVNWVAPNTPFAAALYNHGPYTTSITAYNWAGKLTYKLTESTSLEGSAFGDPSSSNYGFGASYTNPYNHPNLQQKNTTGFSRWDFGGHSEVARLNSSLSPTLQLNIAATAKTSHFTESGFDDLYNISDRTVGTSTYQGLGSYNNPTNHSYGVTFDLQKSLSSKFGTHTFSVGWGYDRAIYDSFRDYSGDRFLFPATNAEGTSVADIGGNAGLIGASTSAGFYLANAPKVCPVSLCPLYAAADGTDHQVYLRQVRGYWSSPNVNSAQGYHAIYGNDDWAINRFVTINAGLRWEEEQMNGPNQQYVFNDNWSPRLGINIDPFGDRKSKIFFNWGRYTQSLPTDAAIRELNQELDIQARWAAPSTPDGRLATNPDGTISPILDAAHLLNGVAASGYGSTNIVASALTPELFAPKTKLNFEEEYVIGLERQFKGFVFSARYTDRRLERIVEDMQGVSPEGANAGLPNQVYVIGNPNPGADYFVNEQEIKYDPAVGPPANCVDDYGVQEDSLGNVVGAACGQNPDTAGIPTPDGKPDGYATPVRRYQAVEIEANKNFSHNFLLRANYRYAKLRGNYEGLFRNDNGQSDPGISSLFDFTQGVVGLLGDQFAVGPLNTDRRDVGNLYGSYYLANGFARGFTFGVGLRGQSGIPINQLASHPVYQNTGEIPIGGRGSAGTEPSSLQLDLHTDYPISIKDRGKLKLAFDVFNVTNSQFILNKNNDIDTGFQTGADPTFKTPIQFQRPFYARGSVRFEF
jgi:hypothetical protein